MELLLQDTKKNFSVSNEIFKYKFNEALIHQVITTNFVGHRQGNSVQKSRSDVIGSQKKPWRQKGTGRARAGSVKSPIWRSGGVTFASKQKIYKQKINKKMHRNALKSILSELFRQNRLIFLKDLKLSNPKTKLLLDKLKKINLEKEKILIILKEKNINLTLASRNLYQIKVNNLSNINLLDLINSKKTILTKEIVIKLEGLFI